MPLKADITNVDANSDETKQVQEFDKEANSLTCIEYFPKYLTYLQLITSQMVCCHSADLASVF